MEAGDATEVGGIVRDEGLLLMNGTGRYEDIVIRDQLADKTEFTPDSAGLHGFRQVDGYAVKGGEERKLACHLRIGKPFEVFHGGDGRDPDWDITMETKKFVACTGLAAFPLVLQVDQKGGIKMHANVPTGTVKSWARHDPPSASAPNGRTPAGRGGNRIRGK